MHVVDLQERRFGVSFRGVSQPLKRWSWSGTPVKTLIVLGLALLCLRNPLTFRFDLSALPDLFSAHPTVILAFLVGLGLQFGPLIWRCILVMSYKQVPPYPNGDLPICSVIVPAYNEGRQVMETLISVAGSDYPPEKLQIIAVDDGSQDDTWLWMQRAATELGNRVELVRHAVNRGKRRALWEGFRRSTGEILVTIDSDSLVEPQTVRNLVAPFRRDPSVGAVAGTVRILNTSQGLIPRMLDVDFTYSFDFLRASQSRVNTVMCTPGCLSAYRRDIVMSVLQEWLEQHFMGVPSKIGEDRAMTNLILREGYHVHFQQDAVVYTKVPVKYRGLCRMLLRWARSNVRETLVMSRFAFKRFRRSSAIGARINLLLTWFSMTAGELSKIACFWYFLHSPLSVGLDVMAGASMAALAPAIFYALRHRNSNCLWAFPSYVFRVFGLSWISLYACFTARQSNWLTR